MVSTILHISYNYWYTDILIFLCYLHTINTKMQYHFIWPLTTIIFIWGPEEYLTTGTTIDARIIFMQRATVNKNFQHVKSVEMINLSKFCGKHHPQCFCSCFEVTTPVLSWCRQYVHLDWKSYDDMVMR